MSSANDVPVFVRSIMDLEPRFLGRVPVDQIDALVALYEKHGNYDGENLTHEIATQFINYFSTEQRQWLNGFEIVTD